MDDEAKRRRLQATNDLLDAVGPAVTTACNASPENVHAIVVALDFHPTEGGYSLASTIPKAVEASIIDVLRMVIATYDHQRSCEAP